MHGRHSQGPSLDDQILPSLPAQASKDQFLKKKGYFDLFGLDFMVTNSPHNQTVLLEANTNPALCVGEIIFLFFSLAHLDRNERVDH
jgi:D-alanine-D-alanine ligase-like ATP-grasp enzyme